MSPYQVGPIAVAVEVTGNFQRYTGGVFYNPRCHNDEWHLNHAVLAVGKIRYLMGPYNAGPNLTSGHFNAGLNNAGFKLC